MCNKGRGQKNDDKEGEEYEEEDGDNAYDVRVCEIWASPQPT